MKTILTIVLLLQSIYLLGQNGGLLLKSPVDCSIQIDAEEAFVLNANELKHLDLSIGKHILRAHSKNDSLEKKIEISADEHEVLILDFDEAAVPTQSHTPQMLNPTGLYTFGRDAAGLKGWVPQSLGYPAFYVELEESQTVHFRFKIEADGKVSKVESLSPNAHPELVFAGKKAIKKWRFNSKVDSVPQWVEVRINFNPKE